MPYDPAQHHRRSVRLRGYDYSRTGSYFVTVVSAGREPLLGQIRGEAFVPSAAGLEVIAIWQALSCRFPTVTGDAFVLMPNHVHFVVAGTPGVRVWQRSYYEHVIRDEAELALVGEYIATNPLRWEVDRENPANIGRSV